MWGDELEVGQALRRDAGGRLGGLPWVEATCPPSASRFATGGMDETRMLRHQGGERGLGFAAGVGREQFMIIQFGLLRE